MVPGASGLGQLSLGNPEPGTSRPGTRLAVLGSPIAHSKSPTLHIAAYRALGLDWTYSAIEVTGPTLPAFIASCDASWRGLSLTMPLKREVLPLLNSQDGVVDLAGGANTVLFQHGTGRSGGTGGSGGESPGLCGFNTDVYGIVEAFSQGGVQELAYAHILGSGATAASVLIAVHQLGARRVLVSARTPANAASLIELGGRLGVEIEVRPLRGMPDPGSLSGVAAAVPDAIISTLPGGADADLRAVYDDDVRKHAVLFDVSYDPWPSPLASHWLEVGGRVIPGVEMLLYQAVAQIRIFVSGNAETVLQDESAVIAAMRSAIGR